MVDVKKIQRIAWKLLESQGSDGEVFRVLSRPITGVTSSRNMNSYDENGNEIILGETEDINGTLERLKFKYIAKQLRGMEASTGALNSGQIRFTCISQDLKKEDYLKNKVLKGDEFFDSFGTKYSIDEVHHVGQMQNTEIVLELICSRI